MERENCHLCEARPPRRSCPALEKDICARCCGTEREESINCPLDCPYLREAREHERPPELNQRDLPSRDIEVTERFLQEQQTLAVMIGGLLLKTAIQVQGAVDLDMKDALEALVRTYKTADSGLVYESRPSNMIAAAMQDMFQADLQKFREDVAQQMGTHSVRDKDVLGVLVFWQREQWQRSNGRRKGRAFIETLFSLLPPPKEEREGVTQ